MRKSIGLYCLAGDASRIYLGTGAFVVLVSAATGY